MVKLSLHKISFGSFVKLFCLGGLCIGFVWGIFLFLISLVGAPVHATLGNMYFTGVTAGAMSLVIGPIAAGISSCVLAAITYLPFNWILLISKGLVIKAYEERI